MWENILSPNTCQIAVSFLRKCHVASGTLSSHGAHGYTTEQGINSIGGTKHDSLCSVGGRSDPGPKCLSRFFLQQTTTSHFFSVFPLRSFTPPSPPIWLQETNKSSPSLSVKLSVLVHPLGTSQVTDSWSDDPSEEFIRGCQCLAVRSLFFLASVFSTVKWKQAPWDIRAHCNSALSMWGHIWAEFC